MEKALKTEVSNEKYASLSPEQREELRKRASELVKDQEFLQAAEILKQSSSVEFDKGKFAGEISWLAALAVAIASVAWL